MPKSFGKRSDKKNLLKSPLSAATEDSDPWNYSPKKYSDGAVADGIIVVNCDPMRPKIKSRSRRISSMQNGQFSASNTDNSQDLNSKNDGESATIGASKHQYGEYTPPASLKNISNQTLVPSETETASGTESMMNSEDNSTIGSTLSGQKAEPSAEVPKRKAMNVLAMNPVGETVFEVQQHPELNRMDSLKQNEGNINVPSSQTTDEPSFQQSLAILRSLSEAETLKPNNQDRPPESFKYYMAEILNPSSKDDAIAAKETSSFDVDIVAGKNDSYDSNGMTHTSLAKMDSHDKFFYSD